MGKPRTPIETRLWDRVARADPDECWLWTGPVLARGYGQIGKGGRNGGIITTHRFSYELANGPIPPGLCVLHRCDVRRCVNPRHLFLGTNADNSADMKAKGRSAKGERHSLAILTEAEVAEIRRLRTTGLIMREIAAKFGVCRGTVSDILLGKNWTNGPSFP